MTDGYKNTSARDLGMSVSFFNQFRMLGGTTEMLEAVICDRNAMVTLIENGHNLLSRPDPNWQIDRWVKTACDAMTMHELREQIPNAFDVSCESFASSRWFRESRCLPGLYRIRFGHYQGRPIDEMPKYYPSKEMTILSGVVFVQAIMRQEMELPNAVIRIAETDRKDEYVCLASRHGKFAFLRRTCHASGVLMGIQEHQP